MNLKPAFFALSVALASTTTSTTTAAVIERDWLAPGDGLLTYDTVNQREWLDFNYLIEAYPTSSRSIEQRLELMLPDFEVGEALDGFKVANSNDVTALATSAGIDVATNSLSTNGSAVLELLDLIGITKSSPLNGRSSKAVLSEVVATSESSYRVIGEFRYFPEYDMAGVSLYTLEGSNVDSEAPSTSVFLYRNVPEPSSCLLAGGLLAAWAVVARRR